MPIQYRNRKGKIYTLHKGRTKTGGPRYFFSINEEGEAAEAIPEGYEIYENPHARVYLRKIQPRLIRDFEKAIIEKHLTKYPGRFLWDIRGKTITVFEFGCKGLRHSIRPPVSPWLVSAEQPWRSSATCYPVIRFTLQDPEKRLFSLELHRCKGSIDEWIHLAGPMDLRKLTKKYLRYVGE